MNKAKVALLMGSDSDWPMMEPCFYRLRELGIDCTVRVLSAHRSPDRVHEFARAAEAEGFDVIVAAAGMAASLAGTVAAGTTLPVIGVPLPSGVLSGIDALLSTVQMPPGVPVATVGIGQAGAVNAAVLAAQILARRDPALTDRLRRLKTSMAQEVERKDHALAERIRSG